MRDTPSSEPEAASLECEVAAVVVTMKPDHAREAITSVRTSAGHRDLAVICVVNDPGARGLWRADNVHYVGTGMNLGWAGGMHAGAGVVSCRYLWAIQDDLAMDPLALGELVSALDEEPGLATVRPLRVDAEGMVQPRAQGWYVDADGLPSGDVPAEPTPADAYVDTKPGSFLLSSGQLIRRTAWDEVGGFDPWFYPWGFVDVDFGRALQEAGWEFRSVPTARMTHEGGGSTTSALRLFAFSRNRSLFIQKWSDAAPVPQPLLPEIDPWIVEQARQGRARPRPSTLPYLRGVVGVAATDVTRSMARWLPEEWERQGHASAGYRPSLLDRIAGLTGQWGTR